MRQIELYINNTRCDLSDDSFILYNWTKEDLDAPAAVKNSYSQSVKLPATSTNNRIFNEYFRTDRVTGQGEYDATARVPFVIYSDGEILQNGYCRLDSVAFDAGQPSYSVSLFGGLGGLFYGLTYDSQGNKLTLAALNYVTSAADDLQLTINRDAVLAAWQVLATDGGDGSFNADFNDDYEISQRKWAVINFAPAYNGKPSDKFSADKAIGRTGLVWGLDDGRKDEDGNRCYASNGYTLVNLGSGWDEWALKDLRSYLQRPVIALRAIITAMQTYAASLGYTLALDPTFFNNNNPYWTRTWLTLPLFSSIETTSTTLTQGWTTPSTAWTTTASLQTTLASKPIGTAVTITASVTLGALTSYTPEHGDNLYFGFADNNLSKEVRNGVVLQLVGYDDDDNIVAASSVISLQSSVGGTTLTTQQVMTAAGYTAKGGASAGEVKTGYFEATGIGRWTFTTPVSFSLSGNGITKVVLYAKAGQCVNGFAGTYAVAANDLFDGPLQTTTLEGKIAKGAVQFTQDGNGTEAYATSVDARTGVTYTKGELLGGTQSPADYLLSYAKTFGLSFLYDSLTKTITLVTRNSFYNGSTIDLDGRLDRAQAHTLKPYTFSAHWYDWSAAMSGAFASYYAGIYGREFGVHRVNTGYDFDSSRNDVMKSNTFKGCAEVMHRSDGNINVSFASKPVPAPFLKTGCSYTLYNGEGEGVEFDVYCPNGNTADFGWWNATYKYYDAVGRPEFCDSEGAPAEGADCLLLFGGMTTATDAAYQRICVTDDTAAMAFLNEQTPCWWAEPATIYEPVTALPHFGRYITSGTSITHSLDYGVPFELGILGFAHAANATLYERFWQRYIADRYNRDTKVLTAKVDLRGLPVGESLLRNFYYYGGSLWVINKVTNYSLRDIAPVDVELIQVQDISNYNNGLTI